MKTYLWIAAAGLSAVLAFQTTPATAADDTSKANNPSVGAPGGTAQPSPAASSEGGTSDRTKDRAADRAATPAAAADRAAADRTGADANMNKDQKFVQEAAVGNLFEIQLGQLAQKQAQSDDVKKIAQQMAQDHQQAQTQLQQLAQSKNWQVPKDLDPEKQACLQKFQSLQGADFDQHFLAGQTGDHVKTIIKFRNASQQLQDPQLKEYAAKTLPKLEQHYQHVAQAAGWTGEATTAGSTIRGTGSGRPADAGHGAPGTTTPGSGTGTPGRSGVTPGSEGSTPAPGAGSSTTGQPGTSGTNSNTNR